MGDAASSQPLGDINQGGLADTLESWMEIGDDLDKLEHGAENGKKDANVRKWNLTHRDDKSTANIQCWSWRGHNAEKEGEMDASSSNNTLSLHHHHHHHPQIMH